MLRHPQLSSTPSSLMVPTQGLHNFWGTILNVLYLAAFVTVLHASYTSYVLKKLTCCLAQVTKQQEQRMLSFELTLVVCPFASAYSWGDRCCHTHVHGMLLQKTEMQTSQFIFFLDSTFPSTASYHTRKS